MCVIFAPSLPYPTVFFASVRTNLLAAIVISSHMEVLFVREWLRQKGLEKLCEIFES